MTASSQAARPAGIAALEPQHHFDRLHRHSSAPGCACRLAMRVIEYTA